MTPATTGPPGFGTLAWRSVRRHRIRAAITGCAIILGVALIVVGALVSRSLEWAVEQSAARLAGRADLIIRTLGDETFSADEAAAVGRLPGVAGLSPRNELRAFFRTARERGFLRLLAVDRDHALALPGLEITSGRPPAGQSEPEVLLPGEWAHAQGLAVGDSIDLMTRQGLVPFRIVGLVDLPGPLLATSEPSALVSLNGADRWFLGAGRPNQLALQFAATAAPAKVVEALPGLLRRDFVVLTAVDIRAGAAASVRSLRDLAVLSGAVSLLVGVFLIYSTLAMAVHEQRREFALLRAAGALPRQILLLVLRQGLAIGLAGSLIGLGIGFGSAILFTGRLIGGSIGPTASDSLVVLPFALLTGSGVALLASLAPALGAARIRPVEELRRASGAVDAPGRHGLRAGLAGTGWLGSAVILALAGFGSWSPYLQAGAILGLLLSTVAAIPLFLPRLAILLGRLLTPGCGISGWLAGVNLARFGRRTSLITGAVFVSVALIWSLATIARSTAQAGQDWIAALLPGNYIISSPVAQPETLVDFFRRAPAVRSVERIRRFPVIWRGELLSALAVEWPADRPFAAPLHAGSRSAAAEALGGDEQVLIARPLAEALGLGLGDALVLESPAGPVAFPVAAILEHPLPSEDNRGPIVFGWEAAARFGQTGFHWLIVDADPAGVTDMAQRAEQLGLEFVSVDDLQRAVTSRLNRVLVLFGLMVGSSLLVASLGLANTLLMSISERTREIAVLRAAGLTRQQVVLMTVLEAAMIGLVGSGLGLPVGTLIAWASLGLGWRSDLDRTLVFDPVTPAGLLGLVLVVAVIASIYPAWRAARIAITPALKQD